MNNQNNPVKQFLFKFLDRFSDELLRDSWILYQEVLKNRVRISSATSCKIRWWYCWESSRENSAGIVVEILWSNAWKKNTEKALKNGQEKLLKKFQSIFSVEKMSKRKFWRSLNFSCHLYGGDFWRNYRTVYYLK